MYAVVITIYGVSVRIIYLFCAPFSFKRIQSSNTGITIGVPFAPRAKAKAESEDVYKEILPSLKYLTNNAVVTRENMTARRSTLDEDQRTASEAAKEETNIMLIQKDSMLSSV
jgi:hypothetical protein